ncbi:MAG: hypothetical protein ACK5RL_11195 [Acidimicrobiales bacterium]
MLDLRSAFRVEVSRFRDELEPGHPSDLIRFTDGDLGVVPGPETDSGGEDAAGVVLGRVLREAVDADAVSLRDAQLFWLHSVGWPTGELAARAALTDAAVRKTRTRTRRQLQTLVGDAA